MPNYILQIKLSKTNSPKQKILASIDNTSTLWSKLSAFLMRAEEETF